MTRLKEPWWSKHAPKIRIADIGYSMKIGDPTPRYHVYIHEVDIVSYLIHRAYHFYDMRIPGKIPGWQNFEKLLATKLGAERRLCEDDPDPRLRDKLLAWTVNQDIRCYELSPHHVAGKSLLVELTDEQYHQIRNKEETRLDEAAARRRLERAVRAATGADESKGVDDADREGQEG